MTPRKVPSDEQLRSAISEVGDALQRALVLSTERIQSVLEDAVVRGRMTRRDAEDLASKLGSMGRDQAAELRDDFDQLVTSLPNVIADVADAVDPRGKKRRKDAAKKGQGKQDKQAAAAEADALVRDGAPAAAPKAPAKKVPAKKTAAKKAPTKKAPATKAASSAKPKPAPAPTTAKTAHVAEPVKQGAGPVPGKTTAKKPAAKQAAAKKPAAAATKSAATATKPAAKRPAKPAAKKPAAKKAPAAKKPAARKLATKPTPAPEPTTATKPRVAEPVKQGAGPTPSPAPKAATSSARELIAAIPKLTKTELTELRTQEAAAKNRASVLAAIDKALA